MTGSISPCPHCGSQQEFFTVRRNGMFESAVICQNGGCMASGPIRESEHKDQAEELALEAYMRAWARLHKAIDLLEWVYQWLSCGPPRGGSGPQYDSDEIPADIEDFLNSARLDLDRRAGVGHNPRDPGGKRKNEKQTQIPF